MPFQDNFNFRPKRLITTEIFAVDPDNENFQKKQQKILIYNLKVTGRRFKLEWWSFNHAYDLAFKELKKSVQNKIANA